MRDLLKRYAEIKLLHACLEAEMTLVLETTNSGPMRGLLIVRYLGKIRK